MKGQTLIETLVALGIAVIVVSAITALAISSLSNAQLIKDQGSAAKHAQAGLEIVRGIRNNDYEGFKLYDGLYCLDAKQTNLGSAVSACNMQNIDNKFIRSVQIQQDSCGLDIARVTVIVSHTSGRCKGGTFCHKSELSSCFSTVNPVIGL